MMSNFFDIVEAYDNFHDEEYMSENFAQNLLAQLNQSRKQKSDTCDIVINVDGKEFFANKDVLSASSLFFRTMFSTNMKEKYENKVTIEEINSEVFSEVINFMYTGKIQLPGKEIESYLHAASMMQIESLLNTLNNFFVDHLAVETCIYVRKLARQYSIKCLNDACTEYIIENFDEVILEKDFMEQSFDDIVMLMTSDDLMANSEENVYKVMINWIKSSDSRRQHLVQLFQHIRLKFISSNFLVTSIMAENMIDENKQCRMLVFEAIKHHSHSKDEWNCKRRKGYGVLEEWDYPLFNDENVMAVMSFPNQSQSFCFLDLKTERNFATKSNIYPQNCQQCEVVLYKNALVFCGVDGGTQVAKYDGNWSMLPNLLRQRYKYLAVVYHDQLLVFGSIVQQHGGMFGYENNQQHSLTSIDKLNDTNTAWVEFCNINVRTNMRAICVEDTLYCCGGQTISNQNRQRNVTNLVSSFNLKTKVEKKLAPMHCARTNFLITSFDKKIFVLGGTNSAGQQSSPRMEFLEITDNMWTTVTFPFYGSPCDIIGDQQGIYILFRVGYVTKYCPSTQQLKCVHQCKDLAHGQQLSFGKLIKGSHDFFKLK